jgi:hypothetical protein
MSILALWERQLRTRAFCHPGGNQLQVAQLLDMTRHSWRHKLRARHHHCLSRVRSR